MSTRLALLAAVVAASFPTAAVRATPAPQQVPAAATWFAVGSARVASLHDADLLIPNDGKTFGVDAGVPAVTTLLAAAGAPTDAIRVSINALLVRLPGRVVLIDTGLGSGPGVMAASLGSAATSVEDVTDVLITHSHGDHVGGLVDHNGNRMFPNAKVRMSAAEWAFMQANPGAAKIVAAIAPQVVTFAPGTEVVPGIRAIDVPGHTPGHVAYELTAGGGRLLDIGDAVHSTIVSLMKPDWTMGFDSDAAAGKASRRSELTRLARSRELIFAPHFPYPGVGRIAAKGDGFVWVPATGGTAE